MKRLAVIGAGGHGRVVADAADLIGWSVDFFDDRTSISSAADWPVVGVVRAYCDAAKSYDGVIVGIGNNLIRLNVTTQLLTERAPLVSIVHPSASISGRATVGPGCFLAAGSIVNIGARLGLSCIVNTGATVDHDCDIADGVHLSPGSHLSGAVTVGTRSWLGTGACVRNNIVIGRDVTIGVGAVVVSDVVDGATAYGVPARTR